MLDRAKLIKELHRVADDLFISFTSEQTIARGVWERIVRDSTFMYKIAACETSLPIPSWSGPLDACIPIKNNIATYRVIAVDGSQIYPDRHQGTSCYLINVGSVVLTYGVPVRAELASIPHVFTEYDNDVTQASPIDIVNCRREEFEFNAGYACAARSMEHNATQPLVVLFDGSLIFWHLEAKEQLLKKFVPRYVQTLTALYDQRIVHAAYVSMPRHRELSNLIRLALCDFKLEGCEAHRVIDHVHDAMVAQFFLQPDTRSTVFGYTGKLRSLYPDALRPYFFYMHNGVEIGRVEIPAWIAHDDQMLDLVSRVLIDQSRKGHGYPIVLAEAHEQAVVKGPDRDFFYHVITKFSVQRKHRMTMSQKSLKKRCIGV